MSEKNGKERTIIFPVPKPCKKSFGLRTPED